MRLIFLFIAVLIISFSSYAQSPLDSKETEVTMTSEDFADAVKLIWDEFKKATDAYTDAEKSKTEFESTADFHIRLEHLRADLLKELETYIKEKNVTGKLFAATLKADLLKYNADTQTYSVQCSTKILIPPKTTTINISCPPNPYLSIIESKKKGYKFAHLSLNVKPEISWFVDKATAQHAKENEQSVFFKTWFRFEFSGTLGSEPMQMTIIPVKIGLINTKDNSTYWNEVIGR
jgi:hypothetical protein